MLPQNSNSSGKIYVNPNFKGPLNQDTTKGVERPIPNMPVTAYINPLFLGKQDVNSTPKIHMNPIFLLKLRERQLEDMIAENARMVTNTANSYSIITAPPKVQLPEPVAPVAPVALCSISNNTTTPFYPVENRKLLCKSKNRLIREPARTSLMKRPTLANIPTNPAQKLVLISKSKLIRKPEYSLQPTQNINAIKAQTVSAVRKQNKTKYKLDNRVNKRKSFAPFLMRSKRKSFVGRYALRRTSMIQNYMKPIVRKSSNSQSKNKKLQLLNINGLLYKSTRNKLQLKDTVKKSDSLLLKPLKPASVTTAKSSQGLTVFVRGSKYVMDAQKFKLTRVPNTETETSSTSLNKSSPRSRIDIGGYTYVSAPHAKNVLIRTTNHLARAYVHSAKQKSVHVLTKHFVKSNVPCPIYQRLGKCAAFERGKCSNVHNKHQVAICSKFLRGECYNSNCLLSHEVSMSKMPVCKFFLQGVCVRNDCPFLHKKLSNNAEVCIEFLRGFCKLADKCNKRHEFVCPELERTGSCANKSCLFCKSRLKKEQLAKSQPIKETPQNVIPTNNAATEAMPTLEANTVKRYFVDPTAEKSMSNVAINKDDVMEELDCSIIQEDLTTQEIGSKKRPKLGVLPAFIPLS